MKHRITTIMVSLCVYAFNSCTQQPTTPYPTTKNIVRLTDQNMPSVEYFSIEKVALPEEYADAEYHVYNDSIAIIVNYKHPQPYIVTFYNLNTEKEIAGYFKKGSGPNELISATGSLHHNCLIIRDGSMQAVSRLDVDSVLAYGNAYNPTITQLDGRAISCVFVDDNTITMANPYYINDGFGVDGLSEFVQYDAKTGEPLAEYKQNDKNFPANVTQRSIVYCNSKYIAFWYKFPVITIYDHDFNLLKMYRDDIFKDNNEIMTGPKSMLIANGFDDFFIFCSQTETYIFSTNSRWQMSASELLENGGHQWMQSPNFTLTRFGNQEIWCFDNDMNLVRRLKCSDTIGFISGVSYNEDSKTFHISAMDEDEEYCLYKCIFKK